MIKCKQNYIGKKFNHLTVIEQVEDFVSPIKKDRKVIYLGQYRSKNDAIIARLNAEKIFFDERSWQIELMERFDV